ncbi:HlyD family secretion protein [Leeia oryzae]|uniref:HlyD family secretion protein n=1 Tax=Leeia oryzae TaxID=356662 RepID=UPI000361C723|nr:HlyD family secretion protein [Leeia oryzae]
MTDTAPASPNANPAVPHVPNRQMTRFILLVLIPLVAILIVGIVYLKGGRMVETDNAYIKADKVPVSTEVTGIIKEVLVRENQPVKAGQPLFRLDPAPFEMAVAKAEAKLAQVRTDLASVKASYREKQAEIALAQTKRAFAMKDQQRQADLVAKNFVSASKFDDAKQTTDIAGQQANALEQDLKRIAETLGGSVDAPIERHPSYLAAQAELAQAKLDLARIEVRASLPGIVSKPPKPGQYITAGNLAMTLVVSGNLWVEANFPETDLTYVHEGQPVSVRVDTYPDIEWKGVVDSLSPATGAEFSVIPAQNATGNWVKIAQRVPVRIRLENNANAPQLRAGLSAIVEINTGHHRRLFGMSL